MLASKPKSLPSPICDTSFCSNDSLGRPHLHSPSLACRVFLIKKTLFLQRLESVAETKSLRRCVNVLTLRKVPTTYLHSPSLACRVFLIKNPYSSKSPFESPFEKSKLVPSEKSLRKVPSVAARRRSAPPPPAPPPAPRAAWLGGARAPRPPPPSAPSHGRCGAPNHTSNRQGATTRTTHLHT